MRTTIENKKPFCDNDEVKAHKNNTGLLVPLNFELIRTIFDFDSSKIAKQACLRMFYLFYNDQLFDQNNKNITLSENIKNDFTDLLEQLYGYSVYKRESYF